MASDSSRDNVMDLRPPRRRVLEDGTFGMLTFVIAETMMFAGLVSAFNVARAGRAGLWPPPGQPRLPVEETAINTLALLLSGVLMYLAGKQFTTAQSAANRRRLTQLLGGALALGAFFVLFQGFEWIALLGQGLTLTSSQHSSFFYLIVGLHGIHAVAALGLMAIVLGRHLDGSLRPSTFGAARVLWYFVVGIWPVLYAMVYLDL